MVLGVVVSVSKDDQHNFSKRCCDSIYLLKGLGVKGDAHCGETVKHRSRIKVDPTQPNLRQVHQAAVMGVVLESGRVFINEAIEIVLPPKPQLALDRV